MRLFSLTLLKDSAAMVVNIAAEKHLEKCLDQPKI